jgi:DNA-binding response OmpR family regulator
VHCPFATPATDSSSARSKRCIDIGQNVVMAAGTDETRTSRAILLVEDDDRIASFIVKGFTANGFDVEWVETGHAALLAVEDRPYSAVVLDLGLPDIDGLDVLHRWFDAGTGPPVVVLTARSDPRDRARALSLGAAAYLTKPAPFASLVASVRAAIDVER